MITTSTGTTITIQDSDHGPLIILDHPDAPADARHIEAGRIIEAPGHNPAGELTNRGFQPAPFSAYVLTAETMRAIADLVEAHHG